MPAAFPFLDPASTPRRSAPFADAARSIVSGMWVSLKRLGATIMRPLILCLTCCQLIGSRAPIEQPERAAMTPVPIPL
jgi:hypothetical protein